MTNIEMLNKAIESLEKNKGIKFELEGVYSYPNGDVVFTCYYPNGEKKNWGFTHIWFDEPDHDSSNIVKRHYKELQEIKNPEVRLIAKLAAYFWSIRNGELYG